MRIHNPLDKILKNEIKIRILRFLCKTSAEWSGRQLAQEIKVSPASCHKALRELRGESVLLLKNVGRSYLYYLNEKNIVVTDLLKPLFDEENKISGRLYKDLKTNIAIKFKSEVISMAIFGSIKKKKERATSDIDIIIVAKNLNSKPKIEKYFEEINKEVSEKYGNIVSPYILTIKEFRVKYKKNLAVIKSLFSSHNLIYGKSLDKIIK